MQQSPCNPDAEVLSPTDGLRGNPGSEVGMPIRAKSPEEPLGAMRLDLIIVRHNREMKKRIGRSR